MMPPSPEYAATLAERERCARLVLAFAEQWTEAHNGVFNRYIWEVRHRLAVKLAELIRSGEER